MPFALVILMTIIGFLAGVLVTATIAETAIDQACQQVTAS